METNWQKGVYRSISDLTPGIKIIDRDITKSQVQCQTRWGIQYIYQSARFYKGWLLIDCNKMIPTECNATIPVECSTTIPSECNNIISVSAIAQYQLSAIPQYQICVIPQYQFTLVELRASPMCTSRCRSCMQWPAMASQPFGKKIRQKIQVQPCPFLKLTHLSLC